MPHHLSDVAFSSEKDAQNFIINRSLVLGIPRLAVGEVITDDELPIEYFGICKTDKGERLGISDDPADFTQVLGGPLTYTEAISGVLAHAAESNMLIYSDENWITN